jgi:hypothetical protein
MPHLCCKLNLFVCFRPCYPKRNEFEGGRIQARIAEEGGKTVNACCMIEAGFENCISYHSLSIFGTSSDNNNNSSSSNDDACAEDDKNPKIHGYTVLPHSHEFDEEIMTDICMQM